MPSPKLTTRLAEAILEKINSVEKAVALKGAEKAEYLKALDVVHGPKEVRAKDLGFGDKTYYHGTKSDIKEIDPRKFGESTQAESAKQAFFASSDPEVAGRFGYIAPTKDAAELEELYKLYHAKVQAGVSENSPELKSILTKQNELSRRISASDGIGGKLTDNEASILPLRFKKPANVIDRQGGHIWGEEPSEASIQKGTNLYKNAVDDPHMTAKKSSDIVATTDPSSVRSTQAAFDPRFKDSSNILALSGEKAAASTPSMSPFPLMGRAYRAYQKTIQEPVESFNKKIAETIANRLNFTKDEDTEKGMATALDTGINMVNDPLNFVPFGKLGKMAGVAAKIVEGRKAVQAVEAVKAAEVAGEALRTQAHNAFNPKAADLLLDTVKGSDMDGVKQIVNRRIGVSPAALRAMK